MPIDVAGVTLSHARRQRQARLFIPPDVHLNLAKA